MNKNTLKEKLAAGKDTFGPFIGFPSPASTELMGWMGFDFVVIDCEHGTIDYETAEHMIRAAELSGTTAIVRIGMNHQKHILRFLEAGAHGVLIPMINNAAQAREVIDAVKFPPVGQRGNYSGRGSKHGLIPMQHFARLANEETWVALQIETLEGLENQEEIISIPHADCIFLGPGDLSMQFGYPGQIGHRKVVETIESITAKCLKAGKQVGTITTPDNVKRWHDIGIRWHLTNTTLFLRNGATAYQEACRKALGA